MLRHGSDLEELVHFDSLERHGWWALSTGMHKREHEM